MVGVAFWLYGRRLTAHRNIREITKLAIRMLLNEITARRHWFLKAKSQSNVNCRLHTNLENCEVGEWPCIYRIIKRNVLPFEKVSIKSRAWKFHLYALLVIVAFMSVWVHNGSHKREELINSYPPGKYTYSCIWLIGFSALGPRWRARKYVLESEFSFENYQLVCFMHARHGWGLASVPRISNQVRAQVNISGK